ncbi:ABC-type oligopeptide transporter ABCB9-like [Lytechinus pictus]|uniref:ABC-type oligopeptide transporter ABCB9-like n=1 Tax=Lytechinus pictus TaxID=7653 RepID=UPI0030BA08D0
MIAYYARLLLIVFFSAADAFFGFAFYFRWNNYDRFGKDLVNFSFTHSMFEFWLFSMLRMVILLSATFGVITDPQDILPFIKKVRYPMGVMNIIVVIYTLAKIMLYTEYLDGNHDNDSWFLTLGVWTMVASLIMYVLWINILQETLYPPDMQNPDAVKLIYRGECDVENEKIGCNQKDDHASYVGEFDNANNSVKWHGVFVRLVFYCKEDWPFLFCGIVALVCAAVGKSFLPFLTGQVLDGVVTGKDSADFHKTIVLMTLVAIFVSLGEGLRNGFLSVAMARLNRRITSRLFDSILKQDINFFDENGTGAILSRLTSDTIIMSDSLGESVRVSLWKVSVIITNTVAMVIISWRLFVITAINLIFLAVISDNVGTYFDKLARKVQNALADANIIAEETISNIKTVRSFALETGERSTYHDKLDTVYHLRKREAVVISLSQVTVATCKLMASVVALFYGGHLVISGKITAGAFFSYVLYQKKIGSSIESLSDGVAHLMRAAGASRKVFELIDSNPLPRKEGSLMPRELDGQLEFKDVTFAYPSRQSIPVLRNISFTASPGKMLAIVGPSGGGKSSCIGLIQHFYQSKSGEILLDGNNIKHYNNFYLNKKIAFVGQEAVLYAKTIKDNISYGLENCSLERIHDAAKLANIHNFIIGLEMGYETEAGERGVRLSGGQKQRVALARALVRNPQILLLDGATNALDAENEHQVLEAILKNIGCLTMVIVTNNLSVIEKADRIVVIDDGMVVEQGCHQELMSANRLYAHLQRHQFRWKNSDNDEQ